MHIQESGEMYLESIFVLSKQKSSVRAIDVGEYLGYSKPSVSRAMGLLKNGGFITVDKDGSIKLTQEGHAIAQKIYDRHTLLSALLVRLGVDPETAAEDACRMEHAISDVSYEAIKAFVEALPKEKD
ncbi:MAG: metal-dependent transcriptional regulator [Clostridia bacterium]|nr:metal-dependent transcriptional regulator [Clostridia bacterium]